MLIHRQVCSSIDSLDEAGFLSQKKQSRIRCFLREDCIYFSMDNILSIISRYLRGASTEEEIKALYSWLSESEENRQLFAGLSANISLHKNATDIDVDNQKEKMLSRLNARIDASEEKKRRVSVFVWAAGLATAAAVVLGLFLSKLSESPVTKDTLLCNNTEATHLYNLPDGSKVCLMPGTSISYNVSGTDERHIRIDGNGFFDQWDRAAGCAGDQWEGYPAPSGNGFAFHVGRDPGKSPGGQPLLCSGSPDPKGGLKNGKEGTEKCCRP